MGKPSDLLILKTVSLEPKHGWAIANRIQQISAEVLQVQQGSPCPALHRLRTTRLDQGQAERNRDGRQAKFYPLTAAGRAQLEKEAANWSRLSAAINLVVEKPRMVMPWSGPADSGSACRLCSAATGTPSD